MVSTLEYKRQTGLYVFRGAHGRLLAHAMHPNGRSYCGMKRALDAEVFDINKHVDQCGRCYTSRRAEQERQNALPSPLY